MKKFSRLRKVAMPLFFGMLIAGYVNAGEVSDVSSSGRSHSVAKRPEKELSLGYSPSLRGDMSTVDLELKEVLLRKGPYNVLGGVGLSKLVEGKGCFVSGKLYVDYPFDVFNLSSYVRVGGGVDFNDVYKNLRQSYIGQEFVFDWSVALGVRLKEEGIGLEVGASHRSSGNSFLGTWAKDGGVHGRNSGMDNISLRVVYNF